MLKSPKLDWNYSKHRKSLSFNQLQAFDLLHDWYDSNPDTTFVLRGYAGTGKTFLIQRVIKSFQECFLKEKWGETAPIYVALAAPTHKARHVLDTMAASAGLDKNQIHVSTLHSLLHVMPGEYDENGKQKLKPNSYSREPFYTEFDLVVIDEASMLGNELLNLIPTRIPTIFIGDPAQLPPVEDDLERSPIFNLPCGIELTQVMRYEGAIAKYVTALRQDLSAQFPPRLLSQGNIEKLQFENWLESAIASYQFNPSPSETQARTAPLRVNRNSAKVLAWTNNRVNTLNNQIRAILYPNAEQIEEGEILFAKEPIFLYTPEGDKADIFMHSCAECEVVEFSEHSSRHHLVHSVFKTYRIAAINDMGREARISIIHNDSWDLVKSSVAEEKKRILSLESNKRKNAWRDYYEFLEMYNLVVKGSLMQRLQYGYAITVHQSQGGTFPNCFVDTSNIFGCRDVVMRNKLLYVAYSRASEQLFCCSKW
ncbi:MAG: AAA family ATPase [Nostoc sp. NMS7]|uniref:ATP-dependent DNA helicase n=1 Tax=Nostoc sp. NMS7 TaxID=2815391 RepID=UPI0025DA75F4|nr:DEAD/DEAH box helicase [Nostoc sp. NMS7]MBN3945186.1 AAA family ATPase [Nostoc sp. NMS7]